MTDPITDNFLHKVSNKPILLVGPTASGKSKFAMSLAIKLERQIVQARVPEISESMQIQLVNFVQGIRELDLKKLPAISETIDWAKTVILLNSEELEEYIKKERLVKNNLLTINHFSPFLQLEEGPNKNKKSIFYAGNIGKPQNIPLFVNYFNESLSNEWTLNIYGSGEEYKHVKSLENEKVVVNEYTERNKLIELTSDIPYALVSLDPNLTIEGLSLIHISEPTRPY